jgi:hypothetical protein
MPSYIGVGNLYGRKYGTKQARLPLGNCAQLDTDAQLTENDVPDYTRLGGGLADKFVRVKSATAQVKLLNITPENWALAMGGTVTSVAAGTVPDEPQVGYQGGLVRLEHPPTSVASVASAASGGTTYDEGTDYTVTASGIQIAADGAIPDATNDDTPNLFITYDHGKYSRIEGLTQLDTELELFFEGLNEAASGKPALVDLWRVFIRPADKMTLISDKPIELSFKWEMLRDPTKGPGLSGFLRADLVA